MLSKILNSVRSFVVTHRDVLFITLILAVVNIPYVVNIQQDLLTEPVANPIVCHDEAAFGMNAKDILLFGYNSLAHDRIYVLGLFNMVAALISFFIFGISLASLRLPYIILNIIGNIVFFDFLRRCVGKKIALVVTCLFALFFSRLVIGKSAMAEAGILPALLILSWVMPFVFRRVSLYFFLGFLSTLAGINKPDNLVVLFFLAAYAFIDDASEKKASQNGALFIRMRWLFFGWGAMILLWAIYIGFIGFGRYLFYYKFELLFDNIRVLRFGFYGNPGTFELIKNNIVKLWQRDPLFTALTAVLVIWAGAYSLFDRGALRNPIIRAGLLFLGLFIFKIMFSSYLIGQWRFAPCYPLPFLALAYICPVLLKLSEASSRSNYLKRSYFWGSVFLGICVLFFVSPLVYKTAQLTRKLIFQPSYKIVRNVEHLRKIIDSRSRVVFAEGHFTYCALFLPNKCYDVVPNPQAKDFDTLESDPLKIWGIIQSDKQIAYLMVRPVNKAAMNFVNSMPGAQLVIADALPFDAGYVYQIRWPQDIKGASPKFLGRWEQK